MARRADVLLASVLGVAVTLTLASLVVDATDARAREPRDPAEKQPCWDRSPTNASRLVPKEGGCDGFDADEVGGVDRARKLDECACVYAQAVCDVQPGLVCAPSQTGATCAGTREARWAGQPGRSCEFPAFRASARR